MSTNSTSSSNSSHHLVPSDCYSAEAGMVINTACNATRAVLVLPVSIYVLFLGLQQWRQQRSSTSISHSDVFTYHMAAMELIWALCGVLFLCGNFAGLPEMMTFGRCFFSITFYGGCFFHTLTCVERYLAVVHPITYLGLKNVRGVRIRNISVTCVWLLSAIWGVGTSLLLSNSIIIPLSCSVIFSLVVVSFCSVSVLCVLIRPGPGEGGRDKERVDQSKQRAFVTIMAIMGVLWLWFGGLFISYVLEASSSLSPRVVCVLMFSVLWFNLPSSLVLPVLYLLRAGKLPCFRCLGG